MDNLYFKKVNEKHQEDSFGADALLEKTTRNATIKTMDEVVHFATLAQVNFENSLQKIEHKKLNRKIDFLQNIPCFKT